ncbi:hypothetical protein FSC37_03590 [Piscinibacter aquaticus]|uniref:Cadherin-like beta sandwich domain-containing protein n=1 Tax=Piscinibacter aquaticus TaxID=392597 RepID=A0A5C6U104_9BURK|nr:hypothetical protein FSC37_03590 [Piscinibacter aquaticus]
MAAARRTPTACRPAACRRGDAVVGRRAHRHADHGRHLQLLGARHRLGRRHRHADLLADHQCRRRDDHGVADQPDGRRGRRGLQPVDHGQRRHGTVQLQRDERQPAGGAEPASGGTLSGTPSASGSSSFTVTATDANGATGTRNYTLSIGAALSTTQAVASSSLTAGVAATAFTPVTASGGSTPYSYGISPALPAGLSFNTSTGRSAARRAPPARARPTR